jgi:3-dehydroquinate synthase
MLTVGVPLPETPYRVHIGLVSPAEVAAILAGPLGKATGVAVLVDARVGQISPRVGDLVTALSTKLPGVRRFDLPVGESCKNLGAIERTCGWLVSSGYDRQAAIIGIGGGAASDHAGFAAAIYLRGIPFAVCSTSLLGMVDASVGGKTGVDLPAGKNLVGAFPQPAAVVADLGFLETLPAREQSAGLAEIVKAALIRDAGLLETLEKMDELPWPAMAFAPIVAAAVNIKAKVVLEDEREAGLRAILNFGHTFGHAIEAASGYGLLHGEAVSLGMIAALSLGIARGVTQPELLPRVSRLLERFGLPVDVKRHLGPEVLDLIEVDKKRRSDSVRFVLCPRPGEAVIQEIKIDDLRREIRAAV